MIRKITHLKNVKSRYYQNLIVQFYLMCLRIWHGLPTHTRQPNDIYRQSMAIYYMTEPKNDIEIRPKALFAPREDQQNNDEIEELIIKRLAW